MTAAMEKAVERLLSLPADRQDEVAGMVMSLIDTADGDELTEEDVRAIAESRAQAARGEFATDEEVRAIWSKYGLRGYATRLRRRGSWRKSWATSHGIRRWVRPACNGRSRRSRL